jgi:hypothetical protein
MIPLLPKGVPFRGLDVAFPLRFTKSGEEEEIIGGKRIDVTSLLEDPRMDEDADNWDALDEEEVEAMKEISSAYSVKNLDDVDIEYYPRFVVKDFGTGPKAVDRLLKVLLPYAKIVYEKQEGDKDSAKVAAELREKQELLKQRKKKGDFADAQKSFLITE